MAVELTFHDKRPREWRRPLVDALGPQVSSGLAVVDGSVSAPLTETGLYRVIATSPCRVRFGPGLQSADGGELWLVEGHLEVRFLSDGDVIAVDPLP